MMKQRGILWHFLDVTLNIVIIVGVVVAIRTFLVSPFQVEGDSMLSTLENRQYIIINKLGYFLGNPVRGDIVVFRPPTDHKKHYVKRIIGEPGDEVVIRDGKVFVKPAGKEEVSVLPEPYLNERNAGHTYAHPPTSGNTKEVRYTVPEKMYFVLGDNREGSLDSRSFDARDGGSPYIPQRDIKGKVWFVALPVSKARAIEPQEYGL